MCTLPGEGFRNPTSWDFLLIVGFSMLTVKCLSFQAVWNNCLFAPSFHPAGTAQAPVSSSLWPLNPVPLYSNPSLSHLHSTSRSAVFSHAVVHWSVWQTAQYLCQASAQTPAGQDYPPTSGQTAWEVCTIWTLRELVSCHSLAGIWGSSKPRSVLRRQNPWQGMFTATHT